MRKMGSDGNDQVILATAGYDHTIRFWQAHTGICKRTVQHGDSVNALRISPDKQHLAAAGYQHIRMYDINSSNPNPVVNFEGVNKNLTAIGFQDDGKWMYTGGEDCATRIWDMRVRNLHCQKVFQTSAPVNCVCLHPNQVKLFIGDQSGMIHIWDLNSNRNEHLNPDNEANIMHMSIDPEGTFLAAVNNKGDCYIWRLNREPSADSLMLKPVLKFEAHKKYALKCQFSPDSTLLATTSADMTAKIWRTTDFSLVQVLTEPNQRWVWDVAFSADSQYVVTASSDNMARLWNIDTGKVKREYTGHQKVVTCLSFCDVLL